MNRIFSILLKLVALAVVVFVANKSRPYVKSLFELNRFIEVPKLLKPSTLPDLLCRLFHDPHKQINKTELHNKLFGELVRVADNKETKCPSWKILASFLQTQILPETISVPPGELYRHFTTTVERYSLTFRELVSFNTVLNKEDVKPFLPFDKKLNCHIITLGIGGDIDAERHIKAKYPHCTFNGADPSLDQGQIYNEIGSYHHVAVSNQTKTKLSVVLDKNGRYEQHEVKHVSLVDFVLKLANTTVVDLLLLDAEGAEYDILPMLTRKGLVERSGITICQISMELHGPMTYFTNRPAADWSPIVTDFLLNTDFIPIWVSETPLNHRIFFINAANDVCIERYFSKLC